MHWLPIKFRPQYKIATFVHRFFDGSLPGYLSQTLCAYEPTRKLRSSCEKLLKVPKRNIKTFGELSFSFLAPSVWNSLPSDLRNSSTLPLFKSRLKTHLFTTAFCQVGSLQSSFLNWTFSSPNMVRTVQTLLHSQLACNEMPQASARTCGRRAADSMIENVG